MSVLKTNPGIFVVTFLGLSKTIKFRDEVISAFPQFSVLFDTVDRGQEWQQKFFKLLHETGKEVVFDWLDNRLDLNNDYSTFVEIVMFSVSLSPKDPAHVVNPAMIQQGRMLWKELHTFAFNYKGDESSAKKFFDGFDKKIGCGVCRNFWRQYWLKNPAPFTSMRAMFNWSIDVHNEVNKKLGRPEYSRKQAWLDYAKTYENFFDRVVIINLGRRQDRWNAVQEELKNIKWPFKQPERFEAVDSNKLPIPIGWPAGGGAWGCMQSHRHVLEKAIVDDINNVLVLEDDLVFSPTFIEDTISFLSELPADWDQLMLGGQLFTNSKNEPVSAEVRKVVNCQRTHCYAVNKSFMRELYAFWQSYFGHCDHGMGMFQETFNIYTPTNFTVGQNEGVSDISGSLNPAKFWIPPSTDAPVTWFKTADRAEIEKLRRSTYHGGRTLDNGVDVGILDILKQVEKEPEALTIKRLKHWITMIQWEAKSMRPEKECMLWFGESAVFPEHIVAAAAGHTLKIIE